MPVNMQPADIEKFVVWSLDHTGWYPHLWFPVVRREHINFPDGPADAEIHAALFQLIRKGSVTFSSPAGSTPVRADDLTPEMLQEVQPDGQPAYSLDLEEGVRQKLHAAIDRSTVPPRGHFELFALGDEFDVNTYLSSASLDFDNVWHRSEGGRPTSGVGKRLGDGVALPLDEQQRIAVEYLSTNREALRELVKFPGVTTFILGLQYNIELNAGLRGFCMSPSPRLMWHALDVGVHPTFYVVLKRPGDADHGFSLETFLQSW
jgi:hypothetical protein